MIKNRKQLVLWWASQGLLQFSQIYLFTFKKAYNSFILKLKQAIIDRMYLHKIY